jgi:hypothetical protein
MSEIAGQAGTRGASNPVVHESYSFACMRCGHGWEQSYEIEHHRDTDGHEFVMYVAEGRVVPSPLSRPSCKNCDGHVLRIMRAGQVSSALGAVQRQQQIPRSRPADAPPAGPVEAPAAGGAAPHEQHHWHLSDLLHPFHRKAG